MDKNDTAAGGISEQELVRLLASLKVEPHAEADFEGRFLCELRDRLTRESVCCPARRLLWAHVVELFAGYGSMKWAYGASALSLVGLAVGVLALQEESPSSGVVAAAGSARLPLSHLESGLASLRPGSEEGAKACTTIKVCAEQRTPYTELSLAAKDYATPSFELSPSLLQKINVFNSGLDVPQQETIPAFTTGFAF